MIQSLFPAVSDPPMPVLLVPPDATLGVLLVSVDDPLVGPVVVHDRVGPVELRAGSKVFGYHSVGTGHFGALCKK